MSGSGNVLSPRVIQNLFEDQESSNASSNGRRSEYSLTQREHDILALLAEGRSNREIAGRLYLSEKTVKAHLAAIFRKLGVTNRTQAAMMAVQMGVGPVPGRARPRASTLSCRSRGSTGSASGRAGPGTCCPPRRTASRPATSA